MDHQTAQIQAACLEYGFCHSLDVLKTADEAQSKLDHLKQDLAKLEKALVTQKENNSMLATQLHNIIAQQQGIKQALSEANFTRIKASYDEIGHRIERLENNIGTNTISTGSSTVQRYIDIQKTINPAFVGALCQFENEDVINDHMIHPGTRGWVLEKYSRWLKGEKKLYFVAGKQGSGKTALSAAVCKLHSSQMAATHFFNADEGSAVKNTATGLIQSIASEMCKTVPEYLIYMEEKYRSDFSEISSCATGDWRNAYDTLLKNPLNAIFGKGHAGKGSGHRQVISIDGLDESERSQWNDVKAFLGAFMKDISHCLCMFVTVRTKYCSQLLPTDVDLIEGVSLEDRAWINRHIKDIEIYLTSSLGAVLSGEDRCDTPEHAKADEFTLQKTVDELLKNSAGRFDYAVDLMETFAKEMGSSGQFLSSVKKAAQPIRSKCGSEFEQKIGDFASPFRAYRDKEGRSGKLQLCIYYIGVARGAGGHTQSCNLGNI